MTVNTHLLQRFADVLRLLPMQNNIPIHSYHDVRLSALSDLCCTTTFLQGTCFRFRFQNLPSLARTSVPQSWAS